MASDFSMDVISQNAAGGAGGCQRSFGALVQASCVTLSLITCQDILGPFIIRGCGARIAIYDTSMRPGRQGSSGHACSREIGG